MKGKRNIRRGFSLVELLIVVVILGILAAIAVPKLSNASQVSRENTLKENLRLLRTQIGVYYTQHGDCYPGYPGGNKSQTPTADTFQKQLTLSTDPIGNTSATPSATYKFGPYMASIPLNPVNSLGTVKVLGASDAFSADGSTGWLYQPATGTIQVNVAGKDSEGKNFSDY